MKFRTEINIDKSDTQISYNDKVAFIGSCFANNMGQELSKLLFCTDVNPFGVLYNPLSVGKGLELLMQKTIFDQSMLDFYNGLWFSFYHHSSFSDTEAGKCLDNINRQLQFSSDFLQQCQFLFITFGTAYVYKYIEKNEIVSNCHKLPAANFERQLLDTKTISDYYIKHIDRLRRFNPELNVVFTVSPVRHLKDGMHGNQISKAVLLMAVDEICKKQNCTYFPAYEIVLDDLRDYRFYDKDMTHPNNLAVEYISEKFADTWFSNSTQQIVAQIEKLSAAAAHRPFNADTEMHRQFRETQQKKLKALKQQYPHIDLSALEKQF